VAGGTGGTPQPPTTTSSVIYDDKLQGGWTSQQTKAAATLSNTTPVEQGSASIGVTITGTNGFLLLSGSAISTTGKTALKFWLHGGKKGNQQLRVRAFVGGVQQDSVNLWNYGGHPKSGQWVEVTVPLADLGAAGGQLTGLKFTAGNAQDRAYLDYIRVE
jgi:hypothetical protein